MKMVGSKTMQSASLRKAGNTGKYMVAERLVDGVDVAS